ncbi:MAG TPA: hypothetical protein VHX65_13915 [Pirellulales bacterium]|nr:hypothetical protein [Pirellulales bacterium]
MDPMFQDERISAYLDGQLPSDERARFEDELARNSELRQVVEELRGLHDSLQAVPRHSLNDDFAEHVLRRAERAMLTGPAVAANTAGANSNGADSANRQSTATQSTDTQSAATHGGDGVAATGDLQAAGGFAARSSYADAPRSRRPWIWAAVAIAVGVMVMVLNPQSKKHDQLARLESTPNVPEEGQKSLHSSASPMAPQISAAGSGGKAFAGGEKQLLRKRAEGLAGEPNAKHEASSNVGFGGRESLERDSTSPPAPPAIPRQGSLADGAVGGTAPNLADSTGRNDVAGSGSLTLRGANDYRRSGARLADSPAVPDKNGPGKTGPSKIGAPPADRLATDNSAMDRKSLDAISTGSEAADKSGVNRAAAAPAGVLAANAHAKHNADTDDYQTLPAGGMIVGEWATTPEVSKEAFQRLLAQRGIAMNESPAANLALISAVRSASTGKIAFGNPTSTTAVEQHAGQVEQGEQATQTAKSIDLATAEKEPSLDAAESPSPGPQPTATVAKSPAPGGAAPPTALGVARAPRPAATRLDPARSDTANSAVASSKGAPVEASSSGVVIGPSTINAGSMPNFAPPGPAAGQGSLEVVYVVGTRDQVLGLIDDLHARPAQYRRMALAAVVPTPSNKERGAKAGLEPARRASNEASPPAAIAPAPIAAPFGAANNPPDAGAGKSSADAAQSAAKPGANSDANSLPAAEQNAAASSGGAAKAVRSSPASSSIADSESTADLAEQPNGLGWAARMNLPPETEGFLQRALAERENLSLRQNRQPKPQARQAPAAGTYGAAANGSLEKDQRADNAKSVAAKSEAANGDAKFGLKDLRLETAAVHEDRGDEQTQAVFVFRVLPPVALSTPVVPTAASPAAPPAATSPSGVPTPAATPAGVAPAAPPEKAGK